MIKRSNGSYIGCRVSSTKQLQQGESLTDQENVCAPTVKRLSSNILKVYKIQHTATKEGDSFIDEIIEDIKTHSIRGSYFVIKSIDRFCRAGTEEYSKLKTNLEELGIQLIDAYGTISPKINTLSHLGGVEYKWSMISPSEGAEIMEAHKSKREVSDILTRTIGAEINLVREGYSIGAPNDGFVNDKVLVEGKKKPIQVADQNRAHFIIKMFELRASGIYTDQETVNQLNTMGYRSQLRHRWSKEKNKVIGSTGGKKLTVKHLQNIIKNPIYCGVNNEKWLLKPIRTKYEGLVDIFIFNKANSGKVFVEEGKDGSVTIHKNYNLHSLKRMRDNPLFPFKSVILCPECGKPFLGSVSKGKSGAGFPAYHCSRNHKQYGVSKKEFEKTLAHFINNLKYKDDFFKGFETTLMNKYREKEKEIGEFSLKANVNVADLEMEKLQKIEAFTNTKNETIRNTLEEQINSLQGQIVEYQSQRNKLEVKENDIHSFVRYAKNLMEHPEEMLLKQENITILRALFGLVFDELPTYTEIVSGTPKLSLVYTLSEKFTDDEALMAGDEGIEPPPKDLEAFVLPLN